MNFDKKRKQCHIFSKLYFILSQSENDVFYFLHFRYDKQSMNAYFHNNIFNIADV